MISLLTAPGVLNSGEKMNYAGGLFLNKYKGIPVFKHSGNMSGYRAQTITFPEQKFTAIALCNNFAISPPAIVEKLADIYLEGQLKPDVPSPKEVAETLPPTIALPEKEALRYAGIYANLVTGKVFKLNLKDGKLISSGLLQYEISVTSVSENRLLIVAGTDVTELNPVFNKSGTISEIKILTKSGKPDIFVPVKPSFDSPQQLSEYAGTYYSDEFNVDYKLTLEGKNLSLQISEDLKPTLTAAYAYVFTFAGGQGNLSFTRDDKGKITGFVFSAVGQRDVRGVAFKRR